VLWRKALINRGWPPLFDAFIVVSAACASMGAALVFARAANGSTAVALIDLRNLVFMFLF
jgi:uncharacterized protein (DUF983 family)